MTRASAQRFPYVDLDPALGAASSLPYLPLQLEREGHVVAVSALVDSGAALNVLPYPVGLQLGAVWEEQTIDVQLTGNLAKSEARAMLVSATIQPFLPVRLAFAWTRNAQVPVILGQVNFFWSLMCAFTGRSVSSTSSRQVSSTPAR